MNHMTTPSLPIPFPYAQVARAHFERTDYAKAASAFEAARSVDRHCLEGMDRYSTALWHLRRGCELSYLAQVGGCWAVGRKRWRARSATGRGFREGGVLTTALRHLRRGYELSYLAQVCGCEVVGCKRGRAWGSGRGWRFRERQGFSMALWHRAGGMNSHTSPRCVGGWAGE